MFLIKFCFNNIEQTLNNIQNCQSERGERGQTIKKAFFSCLILKKKINSNCSWIPACIFQSDFKYLLRFLRYKGTKGATPLKIKLFLFFFILFFKFYSIGFLMKIPALTWAWFMKAPWSRTLFLNWISKYCAILYLNELLCS